MSGTSPKRAELQLAAGGDGAEGLDELFDAAYAVLRGLAHARRRDARNLATLCTTALVHEAYLKLSRQGSPQWESRGQFFRVAALAMRHILINYAERRRAAKRGGDSVAVSADEVSLVADNKIEELLALHEALSQLKRSHPRQAKVVECRFFAGLEVKETAEALGISPATVKRDWQRGQAWLYRELELQDIAGAVEAASDG